MVPLSGTSIDQRLAARRDWALARALVGQTSTVASRVSKRTLSDRQAKVRPFNELIISDALDFLRHHARKQL